MMLLAVLIGTASGYAQIAWQPSPDLNLVKSGLDENEKLDIYFTAVSVISTGTVKITLPKGITTTQESGLYEGASVSTNYEIASVDSSGDLTTAICTIKNSLAVGDEVHFQLPVWATCDAEDGAVQMQVQNAGTAIGATTTRNVAVDALDLIAVLTVPSESEWTESDKTFAQKLTVTSLNGHIASLAIQLKADVGFDLKDFKLDGTSLTNTQVSDKDANHIYTITVNNLNLRTAVLTFNSVHPAVVGQRRLSAIVTAACDAKPGVQPEIEFTVPGDAGTPQMDYIRTTYVASTSNDPLVYGDGTRHLWDGTTSHYMKVIYKNSGDGVAVYTRTNFLVYNTFACIMKNEDVFYRIGGSELLSVPSSAPVKIETSKLTFATTIAGTLLQPLKSDIASYGVRSMTVELPDTPIPAGEYIAFYIPVRGGKIYATDTEALKVDAYKGSIVYGLYCFRTNVLEVQNAKGEAGVADWKDARTGRVNVPRFTEPYDALIVYESERIGSSDIQKVETVNKIRAGIASSEYANTLRIQTPDWVKVTISGTGIEKVTDTEYKITGGLSDLTYTYDFLNVGKPLVNTVDSLRLFLDYSINAGSYRASMGSVSRVTQPIYYIVQPETIELVDFKAERQDDYVGLKPVGNEVNGFFPINDQTKADQADKTIFSEGDLGIMTWTAKITAANVAAGQTLYLPIQFAPTEMNLKSATGDVKIVRQGSDLESGTPQYISSGLKGYVKYTIQTALEANDIIHINIPFTVKVMDLKGSVISECKLGVANNTDPFTDASLKGVDTKKINIGTYGPDLWGTNGTILTFVKDESKALSFSSFSYANNRLPEPWFPYEVRQIKYLKTLTITVPEGYRVDPTSLVLYGPGRSAADSKTTTSVVPEYTESKIDGKQVLKINVKKEFEAGKWPYPDEKFHQILDYKLSATNEVVAGSQTLSFSPTFGDLRPGQSDYTPPLSHTLNYNGYVISTSHNSSVALDNPTKTEVNITVENSTLGNQITGNWLYVEGADLIITSAKTEGQDLKVVGNYIKLGDALNSLIIPGGKKVVVKLELNYTGTTNGKVKIHTLSGWTDGSFDPSGESDVNSSTLNLYRSRTSEFSLVYPSTRINGSLSVDKYVFENNGDEYLLTAKISSMTSQGTLVNPVMEIKTLKGHTFVPASNNLRYGGNTYTVSPSDFEPIMNGPDIVGFIFDMRKALGVSDDILFPGYTDQTSDPSQKEAVLSLKYSIGCDASMAGVGYTGTLKGSSLSGISVTDKTVNSQKQYPKVTLPYEFNMALTTASGNKAFSKDAAIQTIQIEVTLKENPTIPVKSGDIVELELPDFLDLNGDITWSGNATGTLDKDDSRITNFANSGVRTISFPLIHTAYTAKNDVITFSLPVVYKETATNKATIAGSPVSLITAKVMTIETIGLVGCPSPAAQEISAGNTTMDLAFVVPTQDEAMKLFVNGDALTFTINSQDFDGRFSLDGGTSWSPNSTSVQVENVRTSNYDEGFPADGSGINKEVWIDAVFTGYASSFGKVKLTYTLYPSLDYSLSKTIVDADCGSTLVILDDLVTKESQYTNVFFYTDAGCTNKVAGTDQEKVVLTETTFYARSENKGGKETINPAAKVTVKVNTDLGGVTVSANSDSRIVGETLTITATVSTPANIPSDAVYTWYKDGVFLETTTGLTYTKTVSAITESGGYHLAITSPTKGLCRNVSTAVAITITDRPAIIALNSANEIITDCEATASLNLMSLISNSASYTAGETFWWSTTDNASGATAFTSTINLNTEFTPGITHTVYVWAKNMAGNFSAIAASLTVKAIRNTPMSKPSVNTSGSAIEVLSAPLSIGWLDITIPTVNGTPASGGYIYHLYDADTDALVATTGNGRVGENSVQTAATSHTFRVSYDVPTVDSREYSYYVIVTGACGNSPASDPASVMVYPMAEITLESVTSATYCEDNSTALSDIGLYNYIDTPNDLLNYEYKLGTGNWEPLTASTVVPVPSTPDSYIYSLRSMNAKGSYSSNIPVVTITVEKKTAIRGITGNEVTEGDPVDIVVSAEGETPLSYLWEKWDGSNWQVVTGANTGNHRLSPSAQMSDNGERYRVTVTGNGSLSGCNTASSEFLLKVKSRTTPPLGNNRVSWTVIGYGKVEVTADGIPISNGSHVNNGTKLVIMATTWKSNVLDYVTVNGTKYTSSPITYTVNNSHVDIEAAFLGSDPNPDPQSNAEIESGSRIWTEGGYACIYTETVGRVRIVTFNGRLITDQKLSEGESRIQLPDGYYIVILSDGTTQKIAVRNF